MASSTLAIPTTYHKPTPSIRKSQLDTTKTRSEDELLKFFLHGSYDVQRGNMNPSNIEGNSIEIESNNNEIVPISTINIDDTNTKSRCMFEETYMINISVKQPDKTPSSKQIDVRIEKTPSDIQITNKKNIGADDDDDEISSIFDEEENDDVDSVIFNELNSSTLDTSPTELTLADMINKTLTKIPTSSSDNQNNNWYNEQQDDIKISKTTEDISSSKTVEKGLKTSSPTSILPSSIIQPKPTLTSNIDEDKKLFKYLDYLETKEESNQQPLKSPTMKTSKSTSSISKIPLKQQQQQQEQIPIIDLEQLCRSLTVNDLKDELIRKKIYELKILIDEQHTKKPKSQTPLVKPRKDNLPILIAMPPVVQQRRRTNLVQPQTPLLQSKTVDFQIPYDTNYHHLFSNYPNKQSSTFTPPLFQVNKQQYTKYRFT